MQPRSWQHSSITTKPRQARNAFALKPQRLEALTYFRLKCSRACEAFTLFSLYTRITLIDREIARFFEQHVLALDHVGHGSPRRHLILEALVRLTV